MAESNLKIAVILSAVDKATAVIQNMTNKSAKNLSDFSKKAGDVSDKAFAIGRGAGAIGIAMAAPIGLAVKAAEESEVANKRLENIFKSMGETTGKAAKQAEAYASALQMTIGVEDESIMATQAKLATFGKVSDETARMSGVFDRATQAAYDLASAGFGEAEQNAVQLGKALQDPIKGITALAKSGVTFTATEKDKIKTLMAYGKQLEAQKIVLKAIEMQVGGTAKATATMSGKTKAAMGEVAESVGRILLPQMNNLLKKFIPVLDNVIKWIDKNPKLAKTIAMVATGIGALALAASVLAFTIGGVAKAFEYAALTGKLLLSLTKMQTYTDAIATVKKTALSIATYGYALAMNIASAAMQAFGVVVKIVTAIMNANPIILIITAIATAAMLIYKYWEPIKKFFVELWAKIKQVFTDGFNWFMNLPFMKPIKMIIDNWDKIKAYFSDLWTSIKDKFNGFMDFMLSFPKKMYNAGANIVKSIWEGIKSMVNKPIDAIKNMATKIREYLPFSPAKVGPLRDIHRIRLVETIAESIKPNSLTKAMRATTAGAMLAATPVMGKTAGNINNTGGSASVHYAPTIHINGGSPSAKEDFKKLLKEHEKDITKLIEEANRKNNRTKL